jgi:hypothetical protein
VSDLDRAAVLGALDAVYRNVTAVTGGLGEADLMRPSRWHPGCLIPELSVGAA